MDINALIHPTDGLTYGPTSEPSETMSHGGNTTAPMPFELFLTVLPYVYDVHDDKPIGSAKPFEHAPMDALRLVNRQFCRVTDVLATIADLRHTSQALPTQTFEKLLWRFLQDGLQRPSAPVELPRYWQNVAPASPGEAALGLAALGHAAARTLGQSFVEQGSDDECDADEAAPPYDTGHFYKLLTAAVSFEALDRAQALAGPICLYARFDEEAIDRTPSLWTDLSAAIISLPMDVHGRPRKSPRADTLAFLTGELRVHTDQNDPRIDLALQLLLQETRGLPWPATVDDARPQVTLLAAAATLAGRSTDADSFDEVARLTVRLPDGKPRAKVNEALGGEVAEMLAHFHPAGPEAFDHCFAEGRNDPTGRVLSSLLEGFCASKRYHMCADPLPDFSVRRHQTQHASQQFEQPPWLRTLLEVEDALDTDGPTPGSKGRGRLVGSLVSCMSALSSHAPSWAAGLQALAISHMARLDPKDQRVSVAAWAADVAAMDSGDRVDAFVRAWQTASQGSGEEHTALRRLLAREATERFGSTTVQQIRARLNIATADAFLAAGA